MDNQLPRLGDHHRYVTQGDMEFATYLQANATSLGFQTEDFRLVASGEVATVIHKCNHELSEPHALLWWPLTRNPRDRPRSRSSMSRQFLDQQGYRHIPEIVPDQDERIWLIAENWGKPDRRGFDAMIVFDTTVKCAHDVIGESHGFEYALVPQDLKWLIAENDHGYLIVVGDIVTCGLKRIVT